VKGHYIVAALSNGTVNLTTGKKSIIQMYNTKYYKCITYKYPLNTKGRINIKQQYRRWTRESLYCSCKWIWRW